MRTIRVIPMLLLCALTWASPAAAVPDARHTFTIAQINDAYEIVPVPVTSNGRVVERGGMAYVATLLQQLRARGPVLVLHAGDLLSPSFLSNKLGYKGAHMIEALNLLSLDAATFGNHEFDFGCRTLAERIPQSRFPWVSANVDLPPEMQLPAGKVAPQRVLEIAGLKVGVFGLTLPIQPVAGCGPTPIVFRDPLGAAREAVAALQAQQVDLVVALTHQRIEEDRVLAQTVAGIDLIVGGHEHDPIEERVGATLITKAGVNLIQLGVIEVAVSGAGATRRVESRWRPQPVDPGRIAPDAQMNHVLARYEKDLAAYKRVLVRATVPLDIREESVREQESNFGDYVADVMRRVSGTDVALVNGGSFRDDRLIPPGTLTLADIYTILPFRNKLVTLEVSGAQLRQALENGVSLAGERAGRFPQVSGLSFSFDPMRPPGQRVREVSVGGRALEAARKYTLATTDFVAQRGQIDGYTMLPQNVVRESGDLTEVVIRELEAAQSIAPRVDGRIRRGASVR